MACIHNRLEIAHYLLTSLGCETLEEVYINSTDVCGESVVHTTCRMGRSLVDYIAIQAKLLSQVQSRDYPFITQLSSVMCILLSF